MSDQTALPLGVVGPVPTSVVEVEPMIKRPDYFSLFAMKKRGAPAGWAWVEIEAIGDMAATREHQYSRMRGYVHDGSTIKKGARAGQRKPRSPIAGTEREIIFTMAEHDAFLREWEIETGKCHRCDGFGKEWTGWSATEGNKYDASCRRCFGTGKARP